MRAIGRRDRRHRRPDRVAARRDARRGARQRAHVRRRARSRRTPSTSIATTSSSPSAFITRWRKLGYFGLSIPEKYGGHELGNLAMILTTEELSRASLAAAGSLITRPEILAKALLAGGTEAQKQRVAAAARVGRDHGGDLGHRARHRLATSRRSRVAPSARAGGWSITGAKAWCTFAGRADVIALLARTERPTAARKGLTLFIVEKPRFDGHEFAATQPGGGTLDRQGRSHARLSRHALVHARVRSLARAGRARRRRRGRRSAAASRCRWPGFAAGRLQTGGRACGVTQAALEQTARVRRRAPASSASRSATSG